MLTSIALRLATLRESLGIQQKRVAYEVGVSTSAISAWECGERSPTLKHSVTWAEVLGAEILLEINPMRKLASRQAVPVFHRPWII